MVVQLLAIYFLWYTITKNTQNPFGYEQSVLLTYILGTSLVRAIVFSTLSTNAQNEISSGDLSNYLIKPINYFRYWLFRDFSDKALNIIFSVVEVIALVWVLKPDIFVPQNLISVIGFLILTPLAMILYFYFSLVISMTTFWYPEGNGWPLRFFIFTILEFLSGGLFPLDVLPESIFRVIQYLPSTYFLFAPLQVYLGRIEGTDLLSAIGMTMIWIGIFWMIARFLWNRGLRVYGAYGR
jgi:ABC-2 type transport system permease protein